nr:hypothetical protein [Aquabacterium sp.]
MNPTADRRGVGIVGGVFLRGYPGIRIEITHPAKIKPMSVLDQYLDAAERPNTRLSYASALRHFEQEWKGLLPSTSDAVARYLADHANNLSINTLRQRLAALSRWHADQGFADPTKSPLVRQVLKGIRTIHPAQEKRARPLELDDLLVSDNHLVRLNDNHDGRW